MIPKIMIGVCILLIITFILRKKKVRDCFFYPGKKEFEEAFENEVIEDELAAYGYGGPIDPAEALVEHLKSLEPDKNMSDQSIPTHSIDIERCREITFDMDKYHRNGFKMSKVDNCG